VHQGDGARLDDIRDCVCMCVLCVSFRLQNTHDTVRRLLATSLRSRKTHQTCVVNPTQRTATAAQLQRYCVRQSCFQRKSNRAKGVAPAKGRQEYAKESLHQLCGHLSFQGFSEGTDVVAHARADAHCKIVCSLHGEP
jgi:hypothetical protein